MLGPALRGQTVYAIGDRAAAWPAGIQVVASSFGELLAALPSPQPYPVTKAPPAPRPQLAWDETLTMLRDALANLYRTDDDVRRIADEAQVPTRQVKFTGEAITTWHSLLQKAFHLGKIRAIIDVTRSSNEYENNRALADATAAYLAQHPD